MDPYSKDQLLSFYNFHLKHFGDRPESLRWTPEGQFRRHSNLLEIAPDLNGSTVLDYGCGMADLYRFMQRHGIKVTYTGIDINENFIEIARKKHPECRFDVGVIEEDNDPVEGFYDYIFICGVYNYLVPGVQEDLRTAMTTLFKHCNKGLALNALSATAPIKDPELNYTDPVDILRFSVEHLSPYFAMRHDRVVNDFTLFVYTGLNSIPY